MLNEDLYNKMCNRRNKPVVHAAVLLALVGGLGYTFYLYNLSTVDLEASRSEAEKYLKQQESLSSQLQVVYEHRARLERSLQKEKSDHKDTKIDFSKMRNEFLLNITRSKHEAINRFNSLETQYNMLKTQGKELETDYHRLQQQYSRLSSEHGEVVNQEKRKFQLFKEQKTNEIVSLVEEIKTLKQQVVSLRTHLKSKSEETEQYKVSSSRALAASQNYQEKLKLLEEELASYKEKLKDTVSWPSLHETSKNVQDKHAGTRDKYHDAKPVNSKRAVKGNVDVPNQDVDAAGRPRGGNRYRGIDKETGANDNPQREGYSRFGNVALRDIIVDTGIADQRADGRVVPPAENYTVNRWSDVLKTTQQSHPGVGEERGEPSEVTNEKWEEETGRARKTSDEDRKQLEREGAVVSQIGKPVVQPGGAGGGLGVQGGQYDNALVDQEESDHENQDNQANVLNEQGEEEGDKEDEGGDLSREKMNKQIAELEENFQQKQREQQEQAAQAQGQMHAKGRAAAVNKLAPIPPVQRQDTAQEHADNDDEDEDAGNTENEQKDPDEEDPDDAGEEDGNSPHQQQYEDRNYDRSLKAAPGPGVDTINNQQNRKETQQT